MSTNNEPTQNDKKMLTVIVNVDQSSAGNRNRGFEALVNSKLREVESQMKNAADLSRFKRCAELACRFIKEYKPNAKSLAVFSKVNEAVSARELNVPMETEVYWHDHPHVQSLLEAGDEFEEVLIVLLDGSRARILTSLLGTVTEYPEIKNEYPTAHTQAPGNDRTKSQPSFHQKSDEREHKYLKNVAQTTASILAARSIQRIVIAGIDRASKGLYSHLSKDLRNHVISFAPITMHATPRQIADVVAQAQVRAERQFEAVKVNSLLDKAGAKGKAVIGVSATMDALAEGRVHELVYTNGISLTGGRCESCLMLVVDHVVCPKCRQPLKSTGDSMDSVLQAALDTGAAIEQVRGEAAEKLTAAGGIGAFLRH